MSPVSTAYTTAISALDVLTKGNPAIVSALPLAVLAKAAGIALASWEGSKAGVTIAANYREANNIKPVS